MTEIPLPREEPEVTNEELVRFFGVLSHDLKSPIFSIDGFSDLLISDYAGKLDEEGRDFLNRIRSSAHQLKRILDEMNQMVKLLSRPTVRRTIDLGEMIEEIQLKQNHFEGTERARFEIPEQLPSVSVDPEKMREAIGAIVSNALFFNDRPTGERVVRIETEAEEGHRVRICIADNGIGIDPRYAHQIFELGMKLDKSRGGGAGYGLFAAKRVIENHGGALTVETAVGEGSKFCFTLPGA